LISIFINSNKKIEFKDIQLLFIYNTKNMVKLIVNPKAMISPSHRNTRKIDVKDNVDVKHELLNSSYESYDATSYNQSLAGTIIQAWNQHYDLVLSPDHVWTAIATVISTYISDHGEELRSVFVDHEGKEEVKIDDVGNRYNCNWGRVLEKLSAAVDGRIKDSEVVDMLENNFSTSTLITRTVSRVCVLKSMEKYFSYKVCLMCGLPSITLKGTRDDWVKLREKASRMTKYDVDGTVTQWQMLLDQVLAKFVGMFDGEQDTEFWDRIAHHGCGSGPSYISGWMNVFNPYDEKGTFLLKNSDDLFGNQIDTDDFVRNTVEVPFILDDNGDEIDCKFYGGIYGSNTTCIYEGEKLKSISTTPHIGYRVEHVHKVVQQFKSILKNEWGSSSTVIMEILDNNHMTIKSEYTALKNYESFTEISESQYRELVAKHKEAGTLIKSSIY
jgi:hypothetical protein